MSVWKCGSQCGDGDLYTMRGGCKYVMEWGCSSMVAKVVVGVQDRTTVCRGYLVVRD